MQCHKASAVDMESWGKSGRIIRMLNVDCWGREMWNQNNRDWGFWGWYLRFFDFFRFFFSSWPGVCFFSILTRCLFLCILAAHNRLASSLLCGFLKSENLQLCIFINSLFPGDYEMMMMAIKGIYWGLLHCDKVKAVLLRAVLSAQTLS